MAAYGKVRVSYYQQGREVDAEGFTGKTLAEAKDKAIKAAKKFCEQSLFPRSAVVRLAKNDGHIAKFESKQEVKA